MPAPHHPVFTDQMPFLPPNQQRDSTEGTATQTTGKCSDQSSKQICYITVKTAEVDSPLKRISFFWGLLDTM